MINLKDMNYVPEYELDLQGWGSMHPIFETIISEYKPNIIAEIGTWKGASAINMANLCKKYNLNSKIYCVDTWLGSEEFWNSMANTPERNLLIKNGYPQIYYQFLSNVFHTKNQDIIVPIPNTSYIGYLILKYNHIKPNLIYIDGSHEYEDVFNDLEHYYEILDDNGVIFGDDFSIAWNGVYKAVINFCRNKNINFVINDEKWIIKK